MEVVPLCLAVLGVLLTAGATLDDFYFSRHPQNLAVREGASVDLECMVSNTSFIRFYWQLDGETVLNSSRRFQRGSDLHITRVDRHRDAGHFTCIAMNVTTGFSLTSLAASLNIQWLDRTARVQLQSPASPAAVRPGQDVVLRCRAAGSGHLVYRWYRNGQRLESAPRLTLRNKRLQLSGAQPADGGVYSCSVTNDAGATTSDVTLPLVVPSETAARITVVPRDQLVRRRGTAHFHCQYQHANAVHWSFNGQDPLTSDGRRILLANHTLVVSNVSEADVGWYLCRASRAGVAAVPQTYSARLQLAYLSPLTERAVEPAPPVPGLHVVPQGRPFQLACLPPEGRPPPAVWWEQPDGRVLNDPGQMSPGGSALLALGPARPDQSGNYSCVAENLAGTSTVQVRLLVTGPPELVSGPTDLVVEEGDSSELRCEYRGLHRLLSSVSWLKDGRPLPSAAPQEDSVGERLIIPLTELSDAGRYQCVVNSTGFPPQTSPQALLTVKEKLKFSPQPLSRALELGRPARLHCRAAGSPAPTVGWVRMTPAGRPQFRWPAHVRDANGTLELDTVTETDGGQYTCVATNAQGLINATINVTVVVTPKFLVAPSDPTEAVVGRPLRLDCQVYGRPEPSVQWDRNSKLAGLDDPRFSFFKNGSLYIKELRYEDEARYGCIAGNSGGFSRREIQLLVRSSEAELSGGALTPGLASDDGAIMTRTVVITVSAAAAYLLLVAGLMLWCRYRRIKRKQQYLRTSTEGTSVLLAKTEHPDTAVSSACAGEACESTPSGYNSPSAQSGYHSYQSIGTASDRRASRRSDSSDQWHGLERHDLHAVMPLGQGEFGEVYLARVRRRRGPVDPEPIVMVKSLQSPEGRAAAEFAREAELFGRLAPHRAVVGLLALCTGRQPHLMVLEYSDWGDLKQFLLATRPETSRAPPRPPPISAAHAASLCHQVAAGLDHIHRAGFIHRDLAARNCLITSQLEVRISCGRLSRDTYSREYCRLRGRLLPLRWLPAEAALEDAFSARSDVWAWAVLCWEVFRQGELPHASLSDEQVAQAVSRRALPPLQLPASVPAPLAAAVRRCWAAEPRHRPELAELLRTRSGPADGAE
ncbi:tyrosine-protein kinase-like otk [Pollicipes pollicipes]|uniref:tyrosine-protein kinase-like otk n=1 Tax=Pollicipes pollicipes TaxID=41117 RepID=UPI0018856210|nr:tyrosine-protein kinase-like otk [Pollicipes pollicipes]